MSIAGANAPIAPMVPLPRCSHYLFYHHLPWAQLKLAASVSVGGPQSQECIMISVLEGQWYPHFLMHVQEGREGRRGGDNCRYQECWCLAPPKVANQLYIIHTQHIFSVSWLCRCMMTYYTGRHGCKNTYTVIDLPSISPYLKRGHAQLHMASLGCLSLEDTVIIGFAYCCKISLMNTQLGQHSFFYYIYQSVICHYHYSYFMGFWYTNLQLAIVVLEPVIQ